MKKFFTAIVIAVVFGLIPQSYAGRVASIQNVFNAGELSPKMAARTDFAKYHNGCETLKNFVPWRHGGAAKRPGTYYVADVKTHAKKVRLIPFEFSTTQAYMLEFGHEYMRVYMNQGQMTSVDAYTKLLLHMNGDDASTTFTDDGDTVHTVTANGNAQIDTSEKKFGTGAGLFDGTGDYITIPDHADGYMGTGEVTLDLRIRIPGAAGANGGGIFQQRTDATHKVELYLVSQQVIFKLYDGANTLTLSGSMAGLSVNTWHNITVIRGWAGNANEWALCINGNAQDTDTLAITWGDFTGNLEIGRFYNEATY